MPSAKLGSGKYQFFVSHWFDSAGTRTPDLLHGKHVVCRSGVYIRRESRYVGACGMSVWEYVRCVTVSVWGGGVCVSVCNLFCKTAADAVHDAVVDDTSGPPCKGRDKGRVPLASRHAV